VASESQNIKQFTHFDRLDQIFIGNGEGLSISGDGSFSFVSPNDSHITFKLHKLLHVPSILKNLLSVSQFSKDNSVFFEFHPHLCLVKSQETNKVLLQGIVGVDGFYSFHYLKLQDNSPLLLSTSTSISYIGLPSIVATVNNNSCVVSNSVVSSSSTPSLWHSRLGHPNGHVMKLVFNHCNISPSNKNFSGFCSSSCMGKSHRLPSHTFVFVYSPLELIFTYLWGPSHLTSYAGYKYYVSFIDVFFQVHLDISYQV